MSLQVLLPKFSELKQLNLFLTKEAKKIFYSRELRKTRISDHFKPIGNAFEEYMKKLHSDPVSNMFS